MHVLASQKGWTNIGKYVEYLFVWKHVYGERNGQIAMAKFQS